MKMGVSDKATKNIKKFSKFSQHKPSSSKLVYLPVSIYYFLAANYNVNLMNMTQTPVKNVLSTIIPSLKGGQIVLFESISLVLTDRDVICDKMR